MAKITNVQVYGLAESIYRSGYPMLSSAPKECEFHKNVDNINADINFSPFSHLSTWDNPHIKRAIKLAKTGNGHDQFLTGIIVNFDLTVSNKCWVECERYIFLNFISSMSTMHRISKMNTDCCYNNQVDERIRQIVIEKQDIYNKETDENKKKELYLDLLYNIPSGFELTAGMTTNYRCLKNIYNQRKNHKLPDWRVICEWIETLPLAKQLIIN